jgi:DNA-binding Xre family transcriptional regulator
MIADYLKDHNIKIKDLSEEAEVPYRTLRSLINGERDFYKCEIGTVKKLADALNVTLEDIYEIWFADSKEDKYVTDMSLLYGKTLPDKFSMNRNQELTLVRKDLSRQIYCECKVEGLKLTLGDTENILNGIEVNSLKASDVQTVLNLKHTWDFVLQNLDIEMDINYVRKINQEVGAGHLIEGAGSLRTSGVTIGGTEWVPGLPDYDSFARTVHEIANVSSLSDTDKALTLMLYICRTQPFIDGNKRSATIAANKILIEKNKGLIAVPDNLVTEFKTHLVKFYETNDMTKAKDFLYHNCITGFDKKKLIKEPKIDESKFKSSKASKVEELFQAESDEIEK